MQKLTSKFFCTQDDFRAQETYLEFFNVFVKCSNALGKLDEPKLQQHKGESRYP